MVPWGTPRVSPPLSPSFCVGTGNLGGIPSANAKVLVLSICLPTTGEG